MTRPVGERALDELVEPVAVPLLERRALRLPVVREDDDLVRPRRVPARAVDAAELLVELPQRLERVDALEAGMVGHLVVAREGRVDGGTPFHHVREDAVDDQVADDDAHRRAQERIDPAPVTARPHVAAPLARRGRDLEEHLPGEEDERPGDVEAVGEKRPVARVRLLLGLEPAHGQDQVVGLAGEEVAAARAAVPEQADPRPAPALDLGAVRGRRARHQRPGLLLDPPEGRDVLVGAEEDAGLARARLRGEVRLPLGERVRVLGEPARHRRGVAVAHRVSQHRQGEAVDLEEEDPRLVGGDALAGPPRDWRWIVRSE